MNGHRVVLYVKNTNNLQLTTDNKNTKINNFELPENWSVKIIKWPRFWTQLGLSLEMLLHPVDTLFIPAHTVPLIHPENTVVVMHGLEYEFCPNAYSLWDRIYMRCSIKNSCRWANTIVSVSENTKKDLIELYKVSEDKIKVIYEGYEKQLITNNSQPITEFSDIETGKSYQLSVISYLLFIGRIEERKNISNIIKSFEILKEKYGIPHKLVLAGKPGFGFDKIQNKIQDTRYNNQIISTGFISEEEKWELLKKADVFVFPTLYEGFGIPVLEAQSAGCSVVASNNSSIPEVALGSALLVDPQSPEDIAASIYELISDESLKDDIIAKGLENVKRFSWEKCAREISLLITK